MPEKQPTYNKPESRFFFRQSPTGRVSLENESLNAFEPQLAKLPEPRHN